MGRNFSGRLEPNQETVLIMDDLARNMPKAGFEPDGAPAPKSRKWLARLGAASFIFFFVKGLVWLAIGAGAWAMMRND